MEQIFKPIIFQDPVIMDNPSSWIGHIPFAFWLVDACSPKTFVELGMHAGNSYFAFCQAVKELKKETKCFAVDTWCGDKQAGYYGEDVYQSVKRHNRKNYVDFSRLIRSTFDDALAQFDDGTVDLLHIDGLHTYEAVKHDFESWSPKLSDQGVVLFHDVCVRDNDFGVYKLWDEIKNNYPAFLFEHAYGLGVLAVGSKPESAVINFITQEKTEGEKTRKLFEKLGSELLQRRRVINLENDLAELKQQLVAKDHLLVARGQLLAVKGQELAAKVQQLVAKDQQLTAKDQQLEARDAHLSAKDFEIAVRDKHIAAYEQQAKVIFASTSWRVTAPLRGVSSLLRTGLNKSRKLVGLSLRLIFRFLPLPASRKQQLRVRFFKVRYSLSNFFKRPLHPSALPQTEGLPEVGVDFTQKLSFTAVSDPLVSIIIPVYGAFEYTYRCLKSILSVPSKSSYEIVVVDDCSPDDTLEWLKNISGIRVLKNERNSGFIRSCNRGAEVAKGKYILFLNNDTAFCPGCLDELIETFHDIPKAGLVGSKLIYPDGRLQEAGGIIWQDGSGWNYGRDDDPFRPQYNYLRDVDYCSGACIMVPRRLFHDLGCFDERYAPAYYEDTDLAFTIREAGFRVLYQPLSQVIHFEGVSSGTNLNDGVKAYQLENSKKFRHKWQGVLDENHSSGLDPELAKERCVSKRMLIIDICTPTPDKDSGSVDVESYIKIIISLGYKITFIPADNFSHLENYTQDLQRIGVECLYAPYDTEVYAHLKQRGREYDVVMLYRANFAVRFLADVQTYCPDAAVVFNTVDLHYLRLERQAEIENSKKLRNEALRLKNIELDIMAKADKTIVLSHAEVELLQSEGVDVTKISVIPLIREIPGLKEDYQGRKDIVFVGGFQHEPNVDAMRYFVKDIWPLIRKKMPDVEMHIVGSRMPDEIGQLAGNGVHAVGFVADLAEYFDSCRLSVAPLRYGAGLKGKVGASLAYGLPCVATEVAVEGSGMVEGVHVLVENDPLRFANAVCKLYRDEVLWSSLSSAGLTFVQENYSYDAGKRKLGALLDELSKKASKI